MDEDNLTKKRTSQESLTPTPRRVSDYFHLKNLSIPNKLGLIVATYSLIIVCLLVLSTTGMGLLSDLRGAVAAKGLWALSRKEATFQLERYISSGDEENYRQFEKNLFIPLGYRKALIEIKKPNPDLKKMDAGFLEGGVYPAEARPIGMLFVRFHWISYVGQAIQIWDIADKLIDDLIDLGAEAQREIHSGTLSDEQRKNLLRQVEEITQTTTPLEIRFDERLGDSARLLIKLLVWTMTAVSLLLLVLGVFIAQWIARHLMNEIYQLQEAATKIAKGEFRQPIDVTSRDEIGDLARNFKQMAAQREQAEKMLDERAQELAVANKKLVETDRIKDEFFATVSHELRTPLTLVLTPLESLLMGTHGVLSDEERGILEIMHNNATRLLQMVTGLLDFSKLGAGRMEAKREPTDILSVTRSILDDFESMLKRKKIGIRLNAGQPGIISMDRYLYERILFNLLSNALKFTPEGGSISVSLDRHEGRLSLSVSDTGIGISKEDQKHLFEKFRQVEGASTRRFEGTGLGLALVKEFSALLGGTASVESRPGKGSTFTVECAAPVASVPEIEPVDRPKQRFAQKYQADSGLPSAAAPADKTGLPKLLIAEDNLEMASYLALQIQDIAQLKSARNGNEALEVIQAWSPDLVLSDVMMPERDGLSLCRAVKADPKTAHIPVILLTALTHREALLKGWEAGADEYLFKPFHPAELTTRVRSVLSNSLERRRVQLILEERSKKLAELNEELDHRAMELEASNKELEAFSYSVSHDLRAPLRAVSGFANALIEDCAGKLDAEADRYLHLIVGSAHKMGELIDDLLAFSRLSRQELKRSVIDMDKLAQDVLQEISTDSGKPLPPVQVQKLPAAHGDPSLVRQAFFNLVSNAVKYSGKKETPLIEIGSKTDNGETVYYVKDNGAGFDMRYADKLFGVFQRLHRAEEFDGTGVGLAIVQRVVHRHGGRVWAEAKVNEGAIFYFTLGKTRAL